MRTTKTQAKQAVEVYGGLLQERAVISEIRSEEIRGEQRYEFDIRDTKYAYPVQCRGLQELSTLLTSMWSVYIKARADLGAEDFSRI